jgi:glycosyltransferase involved in cell wall biosynthesis
MPLFSVIIPAYNAERYLDECLNSVRSQTFRDFELVVVDDGSTDSTADILGRFALELASVKLMHQLNRGLLAARRAGLGEASGHYVVFLDSDDCIRPDALEVLGASIEETHADVVMFGMSNELDFSRPQFCRDLPFGAHSGQGYGLARKATLRGCMNTMCGKAIALATLDLEADYSPYQGLMHGEDLFQLLPVMDRADSCAHIEEALYFYRRHKGASTMSYRPNQLDDIVTVAGRLLAYGERWGMPAEAAYGALRNFCSTAKILVGDPAAGDIRDAELDRMAERLRALGFDGRASLSGQRPDNRMLLRAILGGRHGEAETIIRVVERLKAVAR